MVVATLKRLTTGPRPVVAVLLLLLASLYLMSAATENTTQFSRVYSLLLAMNGAALLLLVSLIVRNLVSLLGQYRRRAPGARLTLRLVIMFVVLAVAPVSVVYYFSVQFLQRGIDSWFDVEVEKPLIPSITLERPSNRFNSTPSMAVTAATEIRIPNPGRESCWATSMSGAASPSAVRPNASAPIT